MLQDDDSIGLASALDALRSEIALAQRAAASAGVTFPVTSVEIELAVGVTREADGKAGFRIPLINAELGAKGSWKSEHLQTVTITLGPPEGHDRVPIQVESGADVAKG